MLVELIRASKPCIIAKGDADLFIVQGPRSNFEIGGTPLVTQYWGCTRHFFSLTFYNFKNIGGHVPPPLPPYSAVPVVLTAVEAASLGTTTFIGEDTVLLVQLCFHADANSYPLHFRSKGKQACKKTGFGMFTNLTAYLAPKLAICIFRACFFGCDTAL